MANKKSSAKKETETPTVVENTGPLDIVKYRWLYLGLSMLFLIPGIFFIVTNFTNPDIKAPVRLGIDFTGGTMLEYGFEKTITQPDLDIIRGIFDEAGYSNPVVQIQQPRMGINQNTAEDATAETAGTVQETPAPEAPVSEATAQPPEASEGGIQTIVSIRSKHIEGDDAESIAAKMAENFGGMTLLQKYSIGPSLASELLQNGLMALLLAYVLIVGYLTFRFEFDYAVCAIIALVHDALFVFGAFAMMGSLYMTEVDSMFVTAILTVIGFSVHDTIVVFDRIRENYRVYFTKKVPFTTIANLSVNQTLARSINTSLSTLIPLVALYFFGGETTKNFVLAAIIGIIVGTYSSISIASLVLAWWREGQVTGSKKASSAGTPATA